MHKKTSDSVTAPVVVTLKKVTPTSGSSRLPGDASPKE